MKDVSCVVVLICWICLVMNCCFNNVAGSVKLEFKFFYLSNKGLFQKGSMIFNILNWDCLL